MRRFGFLTILVLWITQMAIQTMPAPSKRLDGSPNHPPAPVPIAVAAWALWVIVSAENRQSMESGRA
jgi:hypothetical protein